MKTPVPTQASVSHGGGYGAPSYDAPSYDPPRRPIVTNIPCGTYGNRRSFGEMAECPFLWYASKDLCCACVITTSS